MAGSYILLYRNIIAMLHTSDCSSSEVADETVSGDCKRNGVPCTAEVCPQRSGCKELHVRDRAFAYIVHYFAFCYSALLLLIIL